VGHLRDIVPFTRLTRAAVGSCDRVICVSEATARNLSGGVEARGPGRVRVIPNGVDVDLFRALPERRSAFEALGLGPREGPTVGIAAPLVRWKGQHLLLDAARIILREAPEALFLIAGGEDFAEPGYVEELRRRAESPPLRGHVVFLGFVERIQDFLAALDVAVCASIEPDPLPRAVLEAMAAGVPVVAAATGGLPEMVADRETGSLVPPGDPAALARAVAALLRDGATRRRMGRAGAERAASRFSLSTHVARVMDLYEEILGR
jgi:glycosyltransferase involved in cell wall biosynthesis